MFKIGNIEIPHYPLILAPMEDVTDVSFRYICKQYGADLMYTEFIASEALIRNIDKTVKKMHIEDYERPVGIQIYGHDPDHMVEAVHTYQPRAEMHDKYMKIYERYARVYQAVRPLM